jgi:hypothetical protein
VRQLGIDDRLRVFDRLNVYFAPSAIGWNRFYATDPLHQPLRLSDRVKHHMDASRRE